MPIMSETQRRMDLIMIALMKWLVESTKSGLPTSAKRIWEDQILIEIGDETFTITVAKVQ